MGNRSICHCGEEKRQLNIIGKAACFWNKILNGVQSEKKIQKCRHTPQNTCLMRLKGKGQIPKWRLKKDSFKKRQNNNFFLLQIAGIKGYARDEKLIFDKTRSLIC